ncbi:MAG: GNAT family N-acetyltransferase [Planctomycetota bacterium]
MPPQRTHDIDLRDGLRPSDASGLEDMLRACSVFREDEVDVAMELIADALSKGDQSEYRFLVASADGKMIGYCCYGKIACTLHSFDVYWIAVDPRKRRAGVGRKLLAETEARIHQIGGVRAYVETSAKPSYEPARRFYQACGYRVECVQPDFYAPGDGKVTMVKVLL